LQRFQIIYPDISESLTFSPTLNPSVVIPSQLDCITIRALLSTLSELAKSMPANLHQ